MKYVNRDGGLINGTTIETKTGTLGIVMAWCSENIKSKWNVLEIGTMTRCVVFSNPTDAVVFRLTHPEWCK